VKKEFYGPQVEDGLVALALFGLNEAREPGARGGQVPPS